MRYVMVCKNDEVRWFPVLGCRFFGEVLLVCYFSCCILVDLPLLYEEDSIRKTSLTDNQKTDNQELPIIILSYRHTCAYSFVIRCKPKKYKKR